ncbi:MAG: ribosome-binding factor A [bacterium]|nr:ribosome-binding factor A [bacterium]
MNHRPLRVGKLIREELARLIVRELEFPGALVTITEVEVTKKLDTARVLVSVIPATEAPASLKTLSKAAPELQHLLLKKIQIKPMPHILFEIDHGPENAAIVEKRLLEDEQNSKN